MTEAQLIEAFARECEAVFPGGMPFKQDDQAGKVASAIAELAGRTGRLDQMRVWQAANVDLGEASAPKRAGVKLVWAEVQKRAPTLSAADAAGWARVVARFALKESNALSAFLATRARDSGTIAPIVPPAPGRIPKPKDIPTSPTAALKSIPEPSTGVVQFQNHQNRWVQLDLAALDATIRQGLIPAIEATASRAERGIAHLDAVTKILAEDRDAQHRAITAMAEACARVNVDRELDLLWWSQALYSPSAGGDYRDIVEDAPRSLLWAMANDFVTVAGPTLDPSVVALFVETARKLIPDLDTRRPEGVWLTALLQPGTFVTGFDDFVREDDTLLPVSGWLVSVDSDAVARSRTSERSGRWVVREYLRERMFAAWLAAGA